MKIKAFIFAVTFILLLTACTATEKSIAAALPSEAGQTTQNPDPKPEVEQAQDPESKQNIETDDVPMTKLLYQGHASIRITSKDGVVIYIDPYAGEGYDVPADIILVTHNHSDHNKIKLVMQKPDCTVITNVQAIKGGEHNSFSINGIEIESVEAHNDNHNRLFSGGYIITVDGIKIYMAGDTSKTEQMETFSEKELDYALLPCDGVYNMDAKEAAECAEIIGAKHNIPIHMKPGSLFDKDIAESFDAPNRLIVEAGEEIELIS